MGRIPSRVIRWGVTVIFSVLLVILLLSYCVKYPEMIEVPVTITTLNPPADLMAKSSGKIQELFVEDRQQVERGDIVAVLFNIADYNDVLELERLTDDHGEQWQEYIDSGFVSRRFNAGELQSYLSQFATAIENYDKYLSLNYIPQRRANLTEQVGIQKIQLRNQQEQLGFMQRQYDIERANLARDSSLYQNNVLSLYDYEQAQQSMLQSEMSMTSQRSSITQLQGNISSTESQLIELDLQYRNETNDLVMQLKTARDNLLTQIRSWRDRYIIAAPLSGKVSFTNYWNENQNITAGERFATVVPDTDAGTADGEAIGKMFIPSTSLGKIETGQTVHVKLNGYPYTEFGILKGVLVSISAVPAAVPASDPSSGGNGYAAEVRFPNGLVSTYKKQFDLIHQMDGTAGIITRDMRLIERFFAPVKSLIWNN